MSYVDLRPYKPKTKKREDVSSVSGGSSAGAESTSGSAFGFLGNLAEAGKEAQGDSSAVIPSITAGNKRDVIEILNILNEKLSRVEERMYRIERSFFEGQRRRRRERYRDEWD